MKDLIIRIVGFTVAFLAAIFTIAHIFLIFQGRAIVISQLQSLTKKQVSMERFNIHPLFKIEIRNLKINDIGTVDTISICPSILGFALGNLAFNKVELIKPDLTFKKFPKSHPGAIPEVIPEAEKSEHVPTLPGNVVVPINQESMRRINLILKRVNIKNGTINFVDHSVGENPIKLTFKDLNFTLTNLSIIPHPSVTDFELSAKIPWLKGQEEGKINIDGWVNFFKRDMKAILSIHDIDGVYLYPYYSQWVDLDKAKIEKAKLDFDSNMTGLDNNLTAECHIELTDIVRKERAPEELSQREERVTTAVIDLFKTLDKGKIVLDFTIRTKMDKLEFGFGNIQLAFEEKIASRQTRKKTDSLIDVLLLPAKLVEGTIKGATDISKAVIDGTFAISKELKDSVKASFKKPPKQKKEKN